MKKVYLFFTLLLLCVASLFAQAPEKFTYQAVVRNASNQLVANANVGVRVSVLQGAANGTPMYVETHTVTTNGNGLLTLEIGGGTTLQGSVAGIDWGSGLYFLKTEVDPAGGTNYSVTSTQQMLSVPYALYAAAAGNVPAIAVTPTDTGYVLVLTPAEGTPQTYILRNGVDGAQGPQGPSGPEGPQGPVGPAGSQGPVGPQGPAGADGNDGAPGAQGLPGNDGAPGAPGADGRGILAITGPVTDGLQDTYTILYTDSTVSTFTVTNGTPGEQGSAGPEGPQGPAGADGNDGAPGAQGLPGNDGAPGTDGRGILAITGPVTDGLQDTYTILYTDSTVSTFTVTNGAPGQPGNDGEPGAQGLPGNDGAPGADGRGILSFTGPVSDGNVDTYTILYTDSTTSILTVTNGVDGAGIPQTLSINGDQLTISGGNTVTIPISSGAPGTDGQDGRGIQYVSGPETDGLVDTYTIHYTDSTTSVFTVTNGAPGNDGAPGAPGNDGEPGAQGLPGNDGAPGVDGRGIVTITGPVTNGLQDTYTILYTDSTVSTFTVTNGTPGNDGAPGTPGEDGFSPIVTTNTVSGVGTYVTITDTNGPHTFLIPDNSTSGDTFTQLPANWMEADSTSPQFIMNKPTIPTVPAAVSAFDNDMGYLTGADLTPVQSQIDSLQGQLDSLTNMMNSISEQMEEDNFQCGTSTVKDFDGNVYNTVEIGGQCWMRENLRVTHLKDGTEIPLGDDPTATLRRYYPHNIQMNSTVLKHGWLYPWTTVMDGAAASTNMPSGVQGICPDGWHVPSYAEWTELTNYVNSQSEYLCNGEDGYIAKALADNNTAWPAHPAACVAGNDYSANNATGFSAVAPGEVLINGSYLDYSFTGYYWSTSRSGDNGEFVKVFTLSYGLPGVNYQNKTENYCLSVRCLRDYEPAEAQLNLHDSLAVVAFTGNYNDLTNTPTLAAVATSGNYNDLADKPEIGEGVLTIQINGTDQGTFNANQTDTTVVNISVPSIEEINAMVTSALGDLNDRITALEQSVNGLSAIIANADITLTVPDNGVQEYTLPETLTQFTIVDNGGNGNYHGNTNGSLKLTAPAGKVFKISLEEMATEDNYDILKIYNGLTTTSSATILNISGTDSVPMVFHTPSNQMLVNFHSDFSTELLGFLMNVQVVDKAMACGEDKFMVDVEGNLYSTVQLGDQCWMRENLRTAHYANDLDNMSEYEIPLGSEASDTLPYCFFPNNDSLNLMQYGYLYNWAAVMHGEAPSNDNPSGVQGICPTGWHVPSKAEMQQLRYYVGGQSQFVCGDGYNIAQALASTVGWDSTTNPCAPGYDMASNNATGFSAMPTGVYRSQYDFYAEFGSATAFWNSYLEGDYAGNCSIVYRLGTINIALTPRINGNPIRCLRD